MYTPFNYNSGRSCVWSCGQKVCVDFLFSVTLYGKLEYIGGKSET